MRAFCRTLALYWALLCACNVSADDGSITTQKAVPLQNSTHATETTTTIPEAKIKIFESAICKKCSCDAKAKLLDCSKRNLTTWFNDNEWASLQNGDFIFETIRLNHNLLTSVPQLRTYPVKNLYLGFNNIDNIAVSAFQNLSELATLELSHNKLTSKTLVPDVFKGTYKPDSFMSLDKLRSLDLGYNQLHSLHSELFVHTPNLEMLILSGNTFQVINQLTETAITGLASLKTLDMSYMELQNLPDHFLHGPRELETLILTGNLFRALPNHLEFAPNLKELLLDENLIRNIAGDNIFPSLPNLEYLSISYMLDLTIIGEGAFSDLPKLNTLIATNNIKLSYIDSKAFAKSTANPEIFHYPPLEKLFLHNNNLTVVNHDWVASWEKISTIDLRLNPWICDCTNSWLIFALIPQINFTTPLQAKDIKCASPEKWNSLPIIDLSSQKEQLVCNDDHHQSDGLILVGLFLGILIGVPITLAILAIYRRGCFGLINQANRNNRPLYNRASFSDDFHI